MNFYLVKKHSFSYKKRLNTLYAFVCTVSYFMNNSKTVMIYFVDTYTGATSKHFSTQYSLNINDNEYSN